jgi:hypothetical protein
MWQQRVHTIFSRKVRKKELKPEDGTAAVDLPEKELASVSVGFHPAEPAKSHKFA